MSDTLRAPDADVIRQALRIAARLELPVTARSLTVAEMAAIERRRWGCCAYPIVAAALVLPLAMAFDPTRRLEEALALAGMGLVAVALVWWWGRRQARAPLDYTDPGLVVEVAGDGVTIAVDGRLRRLDFAAAAAAFAYALRGRGGSFQGVVLDLPGRPIALGPEMLGGLDAAAAVIAGGVAAGAWADSG